MDVIITGTAQCQVKSVAVAYKIMCRECKLHCADESNANGRSTTVAQRATLFTAERFNEPDCLHSVDTKPKVYGLPMKADVCY